MIKTKTKVEVGIEVKHYPDKTFKEIEELARLHNEKAFGKQPKELIK